jgi:hypothetical protein
MNKRRWLWEHSPVSRIIFILILLYAICSINVLFLAIGIVYNLPKDFLLKIKVLNAFAIISFVLAAITSAYHLTTMIFRRKRIADWQDGDSRKATNQKKWIWEHSPVSRIIFILIILYAVCSVIVLFLAVGIISSPSNGFLLSPIGVITYAIISFALTAVTSAYHLSTMIFRRKRTGDWQGDDPKKAA